MEILKVENLYKQYQDKLALNNISFSVNAGDIVSIVGPSGAGKSTLLKTIFNLEQASNGNIKVLDEVNKGCAMGMDSLKDILDKAEGKKFKETLERHYGKYEKISANKIEITDNRKYIL